MYVATLDTFLSLVPPVRIVIPTGMQLVCHNTIKCSSSMFVTFATGSNRFHLSVPALIAVTALRNFQRGEDPAFGELPSPKQGETLLEAIHPRKCLSGLRILWLRHLPRRIRTCDSGL